jgi:hypothetical protein
MSKTADDMTRDELEQIPRRTSYDEVICRQLIIIPDEKELHDSGYRMLDFVAVDDKGQAIARLAGGSDALHLDRISGRGRDGASSSPSAWTFDCLPESGCLRLFRLGGGKIACGPSLSSFEIWAVD